jgi:hypothetical protein
MADEVWNGPDMVCQLCREGQRVTDKNARNQLVHKSDGAEHSLHVTLLGRRRITA